MPKARRPGSSTPQGAIEGAAPGSAFAPPIERGRGIASRMSGARAEAHRRQGLFPCEAEVARRLSQAPAEWAAKAIVLERHGLPKIDPVMGDRFWPAVQALWNRRYGLPVSRRPASTERRTSMSCDFTAPGLKRRKRKTGPDVA